MKIKVRLKQRILILISICIFVFQVHAQVDFIASSGSSSGTGNETFSYTLPAGSDRLLVVSASAIRIGSDPSVTSVTYNSQALTKAHEILCSGPAPSNIHYVVSLWYRVQGTNVSSSTANIAVTIGAGAFSGAGVGTFERVDQSTPVDGITGVALGQSITTSSITVTSQTNDMVTDVVGYSVGNFNAIAGSGQTEYYDFFNLGGGGEHIAGSYESGASSVTMSWSSLSSSTVDCGGHIGINMNSNGVILPVDLANFSVKNEGGKVNLFWQTVRETNNRGWEIYHSTDNQNWDKSGFREGRGDSDVLNYYSFSHTKPRQGVNYYRLKQIDYDGGFEYSDVRSVNFYDSESHFAVYPNPVQNDYFTLYIPDSEAEIKELTLYDYMGKVIRKQSLSQGRTEINIEEMNSGMYWVQLDLDRRSDWKKIIIQ